MSEIIAVIPARMESTRFPGKPMAPILGMPMVIHCWKRAEMSKTIDRAIVATCNTEIMDEVKKYGGESVMTANTHVRCTDRVVEAVAKMDKKPKIVVLVQGDEPMIHPEMLDLAVQPLLDDPKVQCTNLVSPITTDEDFRNPNTIKVVVNKNKDVIYMSREAIPTARNSPNETQHRLKQVCVMGFRLDVLNLFSTLAPTQLEILESIDMNRLIEHGIPVRSVYCDLVTQSVDTPADLKRAEALMSNDPTASKYLKK